MAFVNVKLDRFPNEAKKNSPDSKAKKPKNFEIRQIAFIFYILK
jgi:hypothetical protein